MYVSRATEFASTDLEQGDVLSGLYFPDAFGKLAPHLREGPKATALVGAQIRTVDPKNFRFLLLGKQETVIVLSNACDHAKGGSVILAPARPLKLRSDTASKQWDEISSRATSGANPREFYLPPGGPFPVHHSAALDEMKSLDVALLDRFRSDGDAKRIGGLNQDGVLHLRWAVSLFFGRNARDDFAWQTAELLELRLKGLKEKIELQNREEFREQVTMVEEELKRRAAQSS